MGDSQGLGPGEATMGIGQDLWPWGDDRGGQSGFQEGPHTGQLDAPSWRSCHKAQSQQH